MINARLFLVRAGLFIVWLPVQSRRCAEISETCSRAKRSGFLAVQRHKAGTFDNGRIGRTGSLSGQSDGDGLAGL